ncbi:MAG: VCBS repeat-containing protein, partial [Planctomycetota bacterium]|nr:VCBS repeat-containing protein [Planctomycetota bacterium]
KAPEKDIQARLFLFVDGRQISQPVGFLLRRQPRCKLANGKTEVFLSVSGGERLRLQASGVVATDVKDVRLRVGTFNRDTKNPPLIVRDAIDIKLRKLPNGDTEVSGIVPAQSFPGRAFAEVIDARAGESTPVDRVFYVPLILSATPRFLPSDGGVEVAVNGKGLVPLDHSMPQPYPLDFSAITPEIHKGGRVAKVPQGLIRQNQSSLTRLVFTIPPSPDGQPGEASFSLVVKLAPGTVWSVPADKILVYRDRIPVFGPRGVLLDAPPRRVRRVAALNPKTGAPDAVTLTSIGRLARVQLLAAKGNGMFERFGPPVVAADINDPRQREPIDLCAGDFDRDGESDLAIVNKGSFDGSGHSIVLGQAAPEPPLRLAPGKIEDVGFATKSMSADLDSNGVSDLLVLNSVPRFWLGQRGKAGEPRFIRGALPPAVVNNGPYQALDISDLDGDGFLDLMFFCGGLRMVLVCAYGDGTGSFADARKISVEIPGYAPNQLSGAIGVHALSGEIPKMIVVVLAGSRSAGLTTPPTLAMYHPVALGVREYRLDMGNILWYPGKSPFTHSTVGDLNLDGISEVVTAAEGDPRPLRLFVWGPGFSEEYDAIDPGIETMTTIDSLEIDVAVPADKGRFPRALMGLFVTHELMVSGGRENRCSTFLAKPGASLRLIAPDASIRELPPIHGLALGNFRGVSPDPKGSALDLLVAVEGQIGVLQNDGVGGLSPQRWLGLTSSVPSTLTAAALTTPGIFGEWAAYLEVSGRLAVLPPGSDRPLVSKDDLRVYVPKHLRGLEIASRSRIMIADVDGDKISDMVVLLTMKGAEAEGEAVILLLRGKGRVLTNEFPVHMPEGKAQATLIHGNTHAIALGDFATTATLRQEVVVAVPVDKGNPGQGNHLRFYHLEPGSNSPTDDRFVRSFASPTKKTLIAGDQPSSLVAGDFDQNGTMDLAVASGGDGKVHVILNSGKVLAGKRGLVNTEAFREISSSPPSLPPGKPTGMWLGDLNGDRVPDIVVSVLNQPNPNTPKDQCVASFLSSGSGMLSSARLVPHVRTGNTIVIGGQPYLRNANFHPALGDVNRDGRLDLVIGWDSPASAWMRNLHFLFGGVR